MIFLIFYRFSPQKNFVRILEKLSRVLKKVDLERKPASKIILDNLQVFHFKGNVGNIPLKIK